MNPLRRRLRLVSACAALALVASGCGLFGGSDDDALTPTPIDSGSGSPSSGSSASSRPSGSATPETPPPDLGRYYSQELRWTPCGSGHRCATLKVPLDYAKPRKAITIKVLEVPATGSSIGHLVINPGGPGGSGIDYASRAGSSFAPSVRAHFDIVGFDPRGVGRSTPLDCISDSRLDTFVAADPDPDTRAEVKQTDRWLREFGNGCLGRSGDLARHMSTVEAAKDVDILRAALGDKKLSWFGASYGTFLGATYADLFPGRVGRMVLDGAIDPSLTNLKLNLVQAHGFEVALRAYVTACVNNTSSCFLGATVDEGIKRIQDLLAQIERVPLPAGARRLEIGNAVLGVWAPLYNKDYWSYLDAGLRAALNGDGSVLLSLSDAYSSRGPDGYKDNSFEVLYAVNCLDHDDSIPSSKVASHFAQFDRASPTFGRIFAYGLSACATWPIHSGRAPHEIHAEGAAPILVIGTTRDPATPLAWAVSLADQLDSGVLIRRDGDGHTGYRAGNSCVDNAVNAYLVSGKVPPHTLNC